MQYARPSLESTLQNLRHDGRLSVHIADDGSPDGYVDELVALSKQYVDLVTTSNSNGRGYGANFNGATQVIHATEAKYVLPLEDDWKLGREFDTTPIVRALDDGLFGCIRLGYFGITKSLCTELFVANGTYWLRLFADSSDHHVFSGHPRIETVQWEKEQGLWPEGLNPGATEFVVSYNVREGIGWPIELVKPSGDLWWHIGTIPSYDKGHS
jgi:glycosyltransferase involved in cell wall biosynthesis